MRMQRSDLDAATRLARRLIAKKQAKFRAKTAAHACVMDKAARKADAQVVVTPGAEQHKLHVAFGEPWCSACEACAQLKAAKRGATKLSDWEVAQMRVHWDDLVKKARRAESAKQAAALYKLPGVT